MKTRRVAIFGLCLLFFFCMPFVKLTVRAEEPIVVVIDPGHGGKNLGADYEPYLEKEMTMFVAQIMYEELSKYDGVEVYLTHESDVDMDLAPRAEFASQKQADILISLHFNMSEYHEKYGTEVWVSAFDEHFQKGVGIGEVFLEKFTDIGLYRRGIKTRMKNEEEDYYGIIREARARNTTAIIVEHCHLDHEEDTGFCDSKEDLEQFGKLDALAVAQYFGLSSEELGVNYSSYETIPVELPSKVMRPDDTEPDICYIELVEADKLERKVKLSLSALDYDSDMLYYEYSLDGGESFSGLKRWPGADTFQFTMEVPEGIVPQIVVNAYNRYDLYTTSNEITIEGFPFVSARVAETEEETEKSTYEDATQASAKAENVKTEEEEAEEETGLDRSFSTFLKISGICLGSLFVLWIIGYSYLRAKKRKRRRKF